MTWTCSNEGRRAAHVVVGLPLNSNEDEALTTDEGGGQGLEEEGCQRVVHPATAKVDVVDAATNEVEDIPRLSMKEPWKQFTSQWRQSTTRKRGNSRMS